MARGDFVDANGIIVPQDMLRANRLILDQLLTVLLAVVMVAFPAAAAGTGDCCAARHADDHAVAAEHACCHSTPDADTQDEDADPSAPADCPKCTHACCRATADVVRSRPDVVFDQDVIAPVLFPPQSTHDPVTCDAIFHPPRA